MWTLYQKLGYCINFTVSMSPSFPWDPAPKSFFAYFNGRGQFWTLQFLASPESGFADAFKCPFYNDIRQRLAAVERIVVNLFHAFGQLDLRKPRIRRKGVFPDAPYGVRNRNRLKSSPIKSITASVDGMVYFASAPYLI